MCHVPVLFAWMSWLLLYRTEFSVKLDFGGGLFSKWMSIVCLVDGLSGVGLGFKRDKSGYDEGFGFQILDSFKQITFG